MNSLWPYAGEFLLRLGKNVPLWCHGYHGISQQTLGFKRNRVKPGLDEVILEDAFWVWLQSLPLCEMTRSLVVAAGYPAHHLPPLRQAALQTERVSSPSYHQVGFLETEPISFPP